MENNKESDAWKQKWIDKGHYGTIEYIEKTSKDLADGFKKIYNESLRSYRDMARAELRRQRNNKIVYSENVYNDAELLGIFSVIEGRHIYHGLVIDGFKYLLKQPKKRGKRSYEVEEVCQKRMPADLEKRVKEVLTYKLLQKIKEEACTQMKKDSAS